MGSGQSMNHSPGDMMDHHQYPDMNMIFKGIPKMIQVIFNEQYLEDN